MEFTTPNNFPILNYGELGQYWGSRGLNQMLLFVDETIDGISNGNYNATTQTMVLKPQKGSTDNFRPVRIDCRDASNNYLYIKTLIVPKIPNYYFIRGSATVPMTVKFSDDTDSVGATFVSNDSWFFIVCDGDKLYQYNPEDEWTYSFLNSNLAVTMANNNICYFVPGTTPRSVAMPDVRTLPDGFKIRIISGVSNSGLETPTGSPAFGLSPIASSYVNFNTITVTASRLYDRYFVAREDTIPGP